ncbi:hypothetical protein Y032_0096g2902 [Ancylostoma ceylanicum]|uniref:C2H2-type domain-containing protein n=1 Tax=Ancylostoma ceylanicum TaxID=53326 RepID=A0A016TK03_9BILA|nr:hypothetical protein Y032_0096g2902 [Ancylostoma ceylanicum]
MFVLEISPNFKVFMDDELIGSDETARPHGERLTSRVRISVGAAFKARHAMQACLRALEKLTDLFYSGDVMTEYPVVFRCSECTIEQPSLELLESHIWSRHLHNFPFSCAVCGFPAIAHSSLAAHYKQAHSPDQPVEFQRKMHDEVRLRDIIANSIVVPVYEEEDIYEQDPQQGAQSELQHREMEMKQMDPRTESESVPVAVTEDEQPLEVIDVSQGDETLQLSVVNDANPSVGMPLLEQDISIENGMIGELEMYVQGDGRYQKVGVYQNVEDGLDIAVVEDQEILDGQHMSRGTQMVHIDEDGATYEIYDEGENGELLVEGAPYEYQNVQGENVYIEESIPSGSKSANDVRMRLAKQRHIDFVVNKVARRSNGRLKRPLTIYECEDCGKIIRYPSKIEEHRRSHTGAKPHQCPHCGQRFSQKGGLTCHIRLHTGERPYVCTWDCGKSFHSNSALKMHERTHK